MEQNIAIHNLDTLDIEKQIIGHNDEIVDIKYLTPNTIVVATNSEQVCLFSFGTNHHFYFLFFILT
jgi:hypothetical protein